MSLLEYRSCGSAGCPQVPPVESEYVRAYWTSHELSQFTAALDGHVPRRHGAWLYSVQARLGIPDGFSYYSSYYYSPDYGNYGRTATRFTEYGAGDYILDLEARAARWYRFTARARDRSLLVEATGTGGHAENQLRYREDLQPYYLGESTVGPTTFFTGEDSRWAGLKARLAFGETDVLRTVLLGRSRLKRLRAILAIEEISLRVGAYFREYTSDALIRWERDGEYGFGESESAERNVWMCVVSRGC
jgi:hypothetical protein